LRKLTAPEGQDPKRTDVRWGISRGQRLAAASPQGAVRTDEHQPRRIAGAVASHEQARSLYTNRANWEVREIAWLLDVLPSDYRRHLVLRRHPAALASVTRYYSRACMEGAREGYRTARVELDVFLPPHAVDGVLAAYRTEGFKLAAIARAVELVERAIRGEAFGPRL
jgi:hypothetical protein